jgi:hypothetical protein
MYTTNNNAHNAHRKTLSAQGRSTQFVFALDWGSLQDSCLGNKNGVFTVPVNHRRQRRNIIAVRSCNAETKNQYLLNFDIIIINVIVVVVLLSQVLLPLSQW